MKISELVGLTMLSVVRRKYDHDNDELIFTEDSGRKFIMTHHQNCCERVFIEDIDGPLSIFEDTPILSAEEVSNSDEPKNEYDESFTWTFYKFSTAKGHLTIRWYGSSNGYYSESVEIDEVGKSWNPKED